MSEQAKQIYRVIRTEEFQRWKDRFKSKDIEVIRRISARELGMTLGLFGYTRSVGKGVSESKIDFGPGYRIYYTIRKNVVVVLLAGGTKKTQNDDIQFAQKLAAGLSEEFFEEI